jgi:hypothetical protein
MSRHGVVGTLTRPPQAPVSTEDLRRRILVTDLATELAEPDITRHWATRHYDWIARTRILSGHSLTQRTETAICFSPWG